MSTYRKYETGPPPDSDQNPEPGPYGPVADPPPGACHGLPAYRSGWPQPEAQVRDDGDMEAGR